MDKPVRAMPYLAWVFAAIGVPLCAVFISLVPPGQVADEAAHILRAYSVGHGELAGHRETGMGTDGVAGPVAGIDADPALLAIGTAGAPGGVFNPATDAAKVTAMEATGWTGRTRFFALFTIATYAPVFYLPAGLAMDAAEWLGLKPYMAIEAGRAVNALLFLAMGAAAIGIAQYGRFLLFCVLMAPMSVSLAASFNQDGLIIGACVLSAALLTRAADIARNVVARHWDYTCAAVLLACVTMAKPPYLPMLLMLLLPLPTRWRRMGAVFLAAVPALFWTWFITRYITTPIPRAAYQAGPLWDGGRKAVFYATDPAAQLHVLLQGPWRFISLPVKLTIHHGTHFVTEAIGVLGAMNVVFPVYVYAVWMLAIIAALLVDGSSATLKIKGIGRWEILLLVFAALLSLWAVVISQYLSWTNVGKNSIDGPQGRYLLPVVPMAALALRYGFLNLAERWRKRLRWLTIGVAALGLVFVPRLLLHTYEAPAIQAVAPVAD